MAKFQCTTATTVLLLAMAASLCLADQPAANAPNSEGPFFEALSPETIAAAVGDWTRCWGRLSQRGAGYECVEITDDRVTKGDKAKTPSPQCCKNVVEVDRADHDCWDSLYYGFQKAALQEFVNYCKQAVESPVAAPGRPSPRKVLG